MNKEPQVLRVKSREEFNWLIDHLMTETHRALDHSNLWRDVDAAFGEYWKEVNQTPQFWNLTKQTYQDSVILRLGRLFDPHKIAISFGNFLQTVRHHATADPPTFLTVDLDGLDLEVLDSELASVSEADAAVKRLLVIRNQYLAHREARIVSKGTFNSLPQFGRTEIESLLGRALRIVNKYRQLCGRPTTSSRLPGGDDYKYLFELLRTGLKSPKAKAP